MPTNIIPRLKKCDRTWKKRECKSTYRDAVAMGRATNFGPFCGVRRLVDRSVNIRSSRSSSHNTEKNIEVNPKVLDPIDLADLPCEVIKNRTKGKRASANSALGPIQSSKVSKAAGRKTPRPGRQSKIPAERDDGQNQGLNTTISPSLPASVAPRRSRRLSINQTRSGALEADLAADLGRMHSLNLLMLFCAEAIGYSNGTRE